MQATLRRISAPFDTVCRAAFRHIAQVSRGLIEARRPTFDRAMRAAEVVVQSCWSTSRVAVGSRVREQRPKYCDKREGGGPREVSETSGAHCGSRLGAHRRRRWWTTVVTHARRCDGLENKRGEHKRRMEWLEAKYNMAAR